MYLGLVREVKGYFKSGNRSVDDIKKALTALGFEEMDDAVSGKMRMLHFDGEDADDWSKVKSTLKRKFPKLKMSYDESSDEDETLFDEFDTTDFETLTLEA